MSDEFSIPAEWPEARPYLQHALEERRKHLERRADALDSRIRELTDKVSAMQADFHDVRDGVAHLNESFRHVVDQNRVLTDAIKGDMEIQQQRWREYDLDQKTILKVVQREDRFRFSWRVGIICGLYLTLFALIIEKIG